MTKRVLVTLGNGVYSHAVQGDANYIAAHGTDRLYTLCGRELRPGKHQTLAVVTTVSCQICARVIRMEAATQRTIDAARARLARDRGEA